MAWCVCERESECVCVCGGLTARFVSVAGYRECWGEQGSVDQKTKTFFFITLKPRVESFKSI